MLEKTLLIQSSRYSYSGTSEEVGLRGQIYASHDRRSCRLPTSILTWSQVTRATPFELKNYKELPRAVKYYSGVYTIRPHRNAKNTKTRNLKKKKNAPRNSCPFQDGRMKKGSSGNSKYDNNCIIRSSFRGEKPWRCC